MKHKMIGLILAAMDSESILDMYNGIQTEAAANEFDTQGFVIYPSQISSEDYNHNEFYLLETIDYSVYDGLIVVLDTISSEETKQIVLEKLSKVQAPIIAVDCEIPNSYKINTTNYEAVRNLVLHMAKKHGRTKINYISGPSSNAESNSRLAAYLDAMKELGFPTEDRVYEGNFFVNDGRNGLDYFNNTEKGKDYDAVLCGNDMAGVSTICELIKDGYRVPDDVVVAGFDNIRESTQILPNLTTVTKNTTKIGQLAVNLLRNIWNGESVPAITELPATPIYRESCGCVDCGELREIAQENYVQSFSFTRLFYEYNRSFMENGIGCANFQEFLALIKEFVLRIYPGYFSIYISDRYSKLFEIEDYPLLRILSRTGEYRRVHNILQFHNGQFADLESSLDHPVIDFDPRHMADFIEDEASIQFLSSPLHFHGEKIGFVVFGNSDFPTLPDLYFNWLNTMNVTFNNIHSKMMLTKLYRTDSLTGIYNRFGMKYFWERFRTISTTQDLDLNIIFADMNGLKLINDLYGHEEGDFSISYVANVLKERETSKLKPIRYGGDEFILLGVGLTREEVDSIIASMTASLEERQQTLQKPYHISASFGVYMASPDCTLDVDGCIKAADADMYQQKRRYKSQSQL